MENTQKKVYGLTELVAAYGMELNEMLEQSLFDGIAPAICTECGYTTDYEPDQDRGWCENCESNNVVSGLILAGII
jgi:predicted Zn-ribbon and HTH transcriptional regulator